MLHRTVSSGLLILLLLFASTQHARAQVAQPKAERGVRLVSNKAARRVDVYVDGRPFTAYIWPATLMKPVLYPLRAASGAVVTRGFPLEPRPGERADHPHQAGLWFNFGNVNGVDFWNNSTARTPAEQTHMGTIRQRRITALQNGKRQGALMVECDWLMPDGRVVLNERTHFVFHAPDDRLRMVDRMTTLTALDSDVLFNDNKEGLFALRVARSLEQVNNTRDIFLDAQGQPGATPVVNNEGATGSYHNSEGQTGDDVLGTRGRWATLSGFVGDETITLAILDHPQNPNYPTHWFTRGYGLFAANPFGQHAYSVERKAAPAPSANYKLAPHQSVTFRYRVLVISGTPTIAELDAQQRRFANEIK